MPYGVKILNSLFTRIPSHFALRLSLRLSLCSASHTSLNLSPVADLMRLVLVNLEVQTLESVRRLTRTSASKQGGSDVQAFNKLPLAVSKVTGNMVAGTQRWAPRSHDPGAARNASFRESSSQEPLRNIGCRMAGVKTNRGCGSNGASAWNIGPAGSWGLCKNNQCPTLWK